MELNVQLMSISILNMPGKIGYFRCICTLMGMIVAAITEYRNGNLYFQSCRIRTCSDYTAFYLILDTRALNRPFRFSLDKNIL